MSDAISGDSARDRRWLILGVIGLAQLMVVLDLTVMNIALPSAQRALGFTTVERQWVVTAYTLAFGSLLLPGGRLADLLGRKVTFLTGLAGRAAGLQRGVLPGLRLLQRGHAQLAGAVHRPVPGRRRCAWRSVRGLAGPGGPPAAAAPGGARPQPGRRLRLDAPGHGRAVRH